MKRAAFLLLALAFVTVGHAQAPYDLLLKGGHLIDGRNGIDAVRDVAIKDGKIAAVAANIAEAQATKTVNLTGLYVTPGLVDIHVHVYTGEGTSYSRGALSVPPDGFTLRNLHDHRGRRRQLRVAQFRRLQGSHHRQVENARGRVPEHRRQRHGRRDHRAEHGGYGGQADRRNGAETQGRDRGRQERAFQRTGVDPYIQAEEAGKMADIPVMVDFGSARVRTI